MRFDSWGCIIKLGSLQFAQRALRRRVSKRIGRANNPAANLMNAHNLTVRFRRFKANEKWRSNFLFFNLKTVDASIPVT